MPDISRIERVLSRYLPPLVDAIEKELRAEIGEELAADLSSVTPLETLAVAYRSVSGEVAVMHGPLPEGAEPLTATDLVHCIGLLLAQISSLTSANSDLHIVNQSLRSQLGAGPVVPEVPQDSNAPEVGNGEAQEFAGTVTGTSTASVPDAVDAAPAVQTENQEAAASDVPPATSEASEDSDV